MATILSSQDAEARDTSSPSAKIPTGDHVLHEYILEDDEKANRTHRGIGHRERAHELGSSSDGKEGSQPDIVVSTDDLTSEPENIAIGVPLVLTLEASTAAYPEAIDGDAERSANPVSAWHHRLRWTVVSPNGSQRRVDTRVDTGSEYSLLHYKVARGLDLKIHPRLEPLDLKGFGGEGERVVEFVQVTVACPAIGLRPVPANICLVRAKEVPGLLIGTGFIHKHQIDRLLYEARMKHGSNIPADVLSTSDVSFIAPIFDGRSDDVKKRDEDVFRQGTTQRLQTIQEVLRNKETSQGYSSPPSIISARTSSGASDESGPSTAPPTTVTSITATSDSDFSVGQSGISTATSMTSLSRVSEPQRTDKSCK